MKIGFIGTGNMATAIIEGIVNTQFISPKDIYAFDVATDKLHALAEKVGFHACASNEDVVRATDMVVMAVKPNMISAVLGGVKDLIVKERKLVVSIAAGTTIDKLQQGIGEKAPIIRVMPNVNLMVGAGVAAVCGNAHASRKQIDFVLGMFRSAGTAVELEEKDFSTYTAIAGSSPAYAYLFIDSMARAAVKHGMPKELATKIAAQAVLGSAKMVMESAEVPWALIDKVCSPGGTTVAGLLALEEEKFIATVVKGIDATIAKDQSMAKNE